MARPAKKLTEATKKALVADIIAFPTMPGTELAAKHGLSEAEVSRVRAKVRRGASGETVAPRKSGRIETKSRAASFSLRVADEADRLLSNIATAQDLLEASEDPKFKVAQVSVIARALRDISEAKETLMKQGLPGMTKDELRKALEERAKENG